MRYFFDSEFLEDGRTIMPISLALVADDGRELYLELAFNEQRVRENPDPWVRDNVLPHLRWEPSARLQIHEARRQVEEFLLAGETDEVNHTAPPCSVAVHTRTRPEIWAYFASYDWIVMAQLWGRMVDLPKWMPMHPMDLQQWWVQLGRPEDVKPRKPSNAHDALADARWNRDFYKALSLAEDLRNAKRAAATREAMHHAFGAANWKLRRELNESMRRLTILWQAMQNERRYWAGELGTRGTNTAAVVRKIADDITASPHIDVFDADDPPTAVSDWLEARAAELESTSDSVVVLGIEAVLREAITFPSGWPCTTCGRPIPEDRRVYAVPTCHACLPPPPPLPVVHLG